MGPARKRTSVPGMQACKAGVCVCVCVYVEPLGNSRPRQHTCRPPGPTLRRTAPSGCRCGRARATACRGAPRRCRPSWRPPRRAARLRRRKRRHMIPSNAGWLGRLRGGRFDTDMPGPERARLAGLQHALQNSTPPVLLEALSPQGLHPRWATRWQREAHPQQSPRRRRRRCGQASSRCAPPLEGPWLLAPCARLLLSQTCKRSGSGQRTRERVGRPGSAGRVAPFLRADLLAAWPEFFRRFSIMNGALQSIQSVQGRHRAAGALHPVGRGVPQLTRKLSHEISLQPDRCRRTSRG